MSTSKSNFNQALWLSISYVCSMAVGIVSSAILSRYFDKVEYGTYKQIMYVYHILITVFQAGLPAVFTYFLPRYSDAEGKYIVKNINALLFALGLVCSIVLFAFSSLIANLLNNPELAIGLKIFSVFPLFTLPTLGVEGIYTVNKNTRFVAVYNIVTRLFMLVCIVVPVIFIKNDYRYALAGWGVASFVAFIISIIAKNRVYKGIDEQKMPNLYKEVFAYTLPIMGSSIVFMFFTSATQFFISRYYGTEAFAEYSNGYMTLPFAPIFIAPVRMLLTPMFAKASTDCNYSNPLQTLYNSSKQIFVLMIPLIVFAFAYAREIMQFLYGDAYTNSYIYFRIVLMFNFVEMFPFSVILSAIGKSKQSFWIDVLCTTLLWIINLLLVYLEIGNPYIITAVFVALNACSKYFIPGAYLLLKENIRVINKEMIFVLSKILIHTVLSVCLTSFVFHYLYPLNNAFVILCISIVIYYVLLFLSSKIIGVNYLQALLRLKKSK